MSEKEKISLAGEFEWLEALHYAYIDNLGVLAGECDYLRYKRDTSKLVELFRSVDQIPEEPRERLIRLLTGTDKNYEYTLSIKQRKMQRKQKALLAEVYRYDWFQTKRAEGIPFTQAITEVAEDLECDERTVKRAISSLKGLDKPDC